MSSTRSVVIVNGSFISVVYQNLWIASKFTRTVSILLGQPGGSEVSHYYHDTIVNALTWHRKVLDGALTQSIRQATIFIEVAARLIETLCTGYKVLVAGNGGSTAEAQHFACDLAKGTQAVGLPAFRVVSLSDNVPLMAAWANDANYDHIFAEQLAFLLLYPIKLITTCNRKGDQYT
jgi:hypothetical protein